MKKYNLSLIMKLANLLKKAGQTLSQALKTAWKLVKTNAAKRLEELQGIIEIYAPHFDAIQVLAKLESGNFQFAKVKTGELRTAQNFVKLVSIKENGCILYIENENNRDVFKQLRIETLIF